MQKPLPPSFLKLIPQPHSGHVSKMSSYPSSRTHVTATRRTGSDILRTGVGRTHAGLLRYRHTVIWGMWFGCIDWRRRASRYRSAYITLSNLRAGGGRLYFGSIASGRDEAHCFDLKTRREYRITTSAYGSFMPVPWRDGEGRERAPPTAYDRRELCIALGVLLFCFFTK